MYNISICEDNKEHQRHVKKLLNSDRCPSFKEIHVFDSGELLVEAYQRNERFSIILLDMEMNQLNGIQTAEIVRDMDEKVIIIIITSILEYAVEGYTINAFDFLLKPIIEDKFYKVIEKAIKSLVNDEKQVYHIRMRDVIKVIKLSDIIYFESSKKKVKVYCRVDTLMSNENISKVGVKLNNKGFLRISRFYLLNMKYISEIGLEDIRLLNGEILRYSNKHKKTIVESYMNYILGDV